LHSARVAQRNGMASAVLFGQTAKPPPAPPSSIGTIAQPGEAMPDATKVTNRLLAVIAGILVLWALSWTAAISMPFAAAVFLIAVLWPIKQLTNRLMPAPVGYTIAVCAMLLALGLFGWALWVAAQNIVSIFSDYQAQFDELYGWLKDTVHGYGMALPEVGSQRVLQLLRSMAGTVYSALATAGLIVALVIIGFPAVSQMADQMHGQMPRRAERFGDMAAEIARKFQTYVTTTTLNCLITGILSYVFALIVGLEFALTWAVLTFLLNYVPTIGSILSVFPPTLFAILQFEGWVMPAVVFAGFSIIQLGMGTFVFPKLSGQRQAILPIFVLAAMVVWGWLWGIPGALLGVPITAGILIACAHFDSSRWITAMMTQPGSLLAEDRSRGGEDSRSGPAEGSARQP
jgi:predicted PurR-regulated permease PerM